MEVSSLLKFYNEDARVREVTSNLLTPKSSLHLKGTSGSFVALLVGATLKEGPHFIILQDKEDASFFYHDLIQIINDQTIYFFPSSYKRSPEYGQTDTSSIILRTETLNRISKNDNYYVIVTYPEALMENVPTLNHLKTSTLNISTGDQLDVSFINDVLEEYGFQKVDFVFEPGQYSIRGSIIDIYSYSSEDPFRIDFFGNEIDSIRSFDLENQLSKERLETITIIPNLTGQNNSDHFLKVIPDNSKLWIDSPELIASRIKEVYNKIGSFNITSDEGSDESSLIEKENFCHENHFNIEIERYSVISWGSSNTLQAPLMHFNTSPQPVFHKNFELLENDLNSRNSDGYQCFILSDNPIQLKRLKSIFEDRGLSIRYDEIDHALHAGFIDNDLKLCIYTDHQIFERYHKFSLRTDKIKVAKQSISIKELNRLNPGDYIVHIDHGVGKFGGLVNTEVNGKPQEAIKLVFRDNDVLLVNIHSLHRISKYKSKDGEPPKINKLGTAAWKNLKEKTKSKVKDIARELIALYAKRKSEPGFAFSPDSYMQNELEASFFFEDTPDQEKTTKAVKEDMESITPMDRLVCGDVGFGKTEIAVRAAFKAAADNKQVAILVPTTILALQHFKTFSERLKDFPVNVDYISRLRKTKDITNAIKKIKDGTLEIIIGTHRLIGKDIKFKNLGLLIIDEEQRFGVSVKEKLKQLRINVDTLTLTATPIPRTLQFSLMGARDLSILNTPPPNRQPIITELHSFNEQIIIEAIQYEVDRGGQVYFINNRVQNIQEIETLVNRLLPNIKTVVAHGQLEGQLLETIMLDFISGDYDVLIATTIIESGLDIPNANTIIINNAHNFGLSELHQLRGRVGRSNKKAFCYLLAPPISTLTQDARRRLKIIEEFSDLGSGFNIAMQDLDIRGAGNLLGGEQSGFISDIGFETYHKILNEALLELRETEFKDLFEEKTESKEEPSQYASDCQIETDIEVLIPENYIRNIAERMQLYRELDNISDEKDLEQFSNNLHDRFGEVPVQTRELMEIVRVRWLAQKLGIEKILLKNNLLILYFIADQDSPFYRSERFTKILEWIQSHQQKVKMQESKGRLSLRIQNLESVSELKSVLQDIIGIQPN